MVFVYGCSFYYFATSNAQEITKEKEPARFGIGIAYGFKDRVKELIHPIELTVRYNLSEKHSFYVNVPLGWKSWRDDYASVDPVIRGYYTHKMRLYGLGIGYDYSIVSYKNLDLFAGGGWNTRDFIIDIRRFKKESLSLFNVIDSMIILYIPKWD